MTKPRAVVRHPLEDVVERLMHENTHNRLRVEQVEFLLRQRAAYTDGLHIQSAVAAVLTERDNLQKQLHDYEVLHQELRSMLRSGDASGAYDRLAKLLHSR